MHNLNETIFFGINNLAGTNSFFDFFFTFITSYYTVFLIFIIVFLIVFFDQKDIAFGERLKNKKIYYIALSTLMTFLIVYLLKHVFKVPRPFEVLRGVHQLVTESKGDSFPSAHAALTMALATAVYLVNPRFGKFVLAKVLFVVSILIAYSRVHVGVHYPIDVITGALIGATVSFVYFKMFRKYLD